MILTWHEMRHLRWHFRTSIPPSAAPFNHALPVGSCQGASELEDIQMAAGDDTVPSLPLPVFSIAMMRLSE